MTSPEPLRRAALEALCRRIADLEITAWNRDGEPVVTMPKRDAHRLLAVIERARQLRGSNGR